MVKLGYALSSEEHAPHDLARYAHLAEQSGFSFALISDHYHPWIERQGHSPFVWSVIGAISQTTQRLALGTGVTCPTIRIHPAIIAQAAATAALMMPGRFFLGLGTGENLNEHILGTHWPPIDVRQEMLEEAIEILRLLWKGENRSHRGKYYTVENARIFSLPDKPPPILIAGSGPDSARLAGRIADGLISTIPEADLIKAFRTAGGINKPRYGQMTVCWAEKEDQARRTAREWWPTTAIPGKLMTELATPAEFEAAAEPVTEEAVAKSIVCGPDPSKHVEEINKYANAGFDHVYVHQVGPDQQGFFRFYERDVLPRLS
ncbi:MAG: TIGR03557 family F420-dependent LLM class oxidoreductase [Deltaproteobacteria bacterium]|nr:TIGR03557 family F420-dependent LLM class oxidoreductase [Deltaproteobacteria bacterium]